MLKYKIFSPIFLIIEDPKNSLLADSLNFIININMELEYDVNRVKRIGKFILVAAYATMTSEKIIELFKDNRIDLVPEDFEITEEVYKYFPAYNRVRGTFMNGGIPDSDELDEGIKPLVDVLNKFPGIKTFASCDGHGERFADILWKAKDLVVQELLITSFDFAFNNIVEEFNFSPVDFRIDYMCGINPTSSAIRNAGLYFELRINYNTSVISFEQMKSFVKKSSELLGTYLEPSNVK